MTQQFRILVVDDDEVDRLAVIRALTEAGLVSDLVQATTGKEALQVLRAQSFDCILMDNMLPDKDGLVMLAELCREGVKTPVIMMTGQGSEQLAVDLMRAGASDYLSKSRVSLDHLARSVRNAVRVRRAEDVAREALDEAREQARIANALYHIGTRLAAERDLKKLVQMVTDEATQLIDAQFGAFFYNVVNPRGESYMLYTISGVPREAFEKFPMPRNTEIFAPTFAGTGVVRLDDVTQDPRYGKNTPHHGMPEGHLPVHSYLAVPVTGRDGEVIGGLFFGHEETGQFDEADERVVVAIASQAAVAIDNARLYDALRTGEQQYRFLAESIPQMVWTCLPDGTHDYFNQYWTHYTGLTLDESLREDGWKKLLHPDDLATTSEKWSQALRTGEPYEIHERFRRASDGAYRWHLVRATPMRDANGTIVKWFGTCTDLHDLRGAEEALRIHRERMDLVLDASALGLWYCDLPFDKLVWNEKCKEHFFLPADAEVTIDKFYGMIHPDDRERTRESIENAIAARSEYDVVYRTVGPRGQINWIRAIGRGFYDASGAPTRFDGVTVDVSRQKEGEEALRVAKEAAEAANSAKDRFLAVLSHELRTPLMPVLTVVQSLALEPKVSQEVRDAMEVIRRNIELEARLIDDLLDLTRISRGRLVLNFDTVDLHQLIRNAMDICATDLVAKQIGSTLDLSAKKHHLKGDPARLQQIFWNLFKNAIKFTPARGHLTIHSFDDPSGSVKVKVTDTGIGIDPSALPRIFDAFEQVDQSMARQFGGLGLGLAISKALVDLHGGKIVADSAGKDRGATFTVELRPTSAALAETGEPSLTPTSEKTPTGLRILLVDDHHDTNRAMARLLQRMGYAVQTADSVRSALDAAGNEKFDLLISDIGLPDGSGLELMRELIQRSPIKGIALSGFGMEEDIQRSKEAGFYEHLTKPINFKRLEVAIRELAGNS